MNTLPGLRSTFDEDAERYSRYRPHYPKELFDKLIRDTKLTSSSRLLEIGPGTGQATKPLAAIGCDITSVELGAALADKARAELRSYPNVHIITGSFEDTNLPESSYDLVFSATAFHWVKDEYKFTKTTKLLKPNGYLVIIHTEHISDDKGDNFFFASKPIYSKYMPSSDPVNRDKDLKLPSINQLQPPHIDNLLFTLESFTVFPRVITYSARDYASLLSTYSPTIALAPNKRQGFLKDIETLIIEQFGGTLEKRFAFTLTIAQKK